MARLAILLALALTACSSAPLDEKRLNASLGKLWSIRAEAELLASENPREAFARAHDEALRKNLDDVKDDLARGVDDPALIPVWTSAQRLAADVDARLPRAEP